MTSLREQTQDWELPAWQSRDTLLAFIRHWAPDLRIRTAKLADGRRACGARFTLLGKMVEVEAVETDKLDCDYAIVRRVAWHIHRAIGYPTAFDDAKRVRLQKEVIAASLAGDDALRDRLALELAMHNEGRTGFVATRTKFGT